MLPLVVLVHLLSRLEFHTAFRASEILARHVATSDKVQEETSRYGSIV
jgi:hypothetical protein